MYLSTNRKGKQELAQAALPLRFLLIVVVSVNTQGIKLANAQTGLTPKELRIGLVCNETGYGGLINSAGAISLAIDKLKQEGYLRNINLTLVISFTLIFTMITSFLI